MERRASIAIDIDKYLALRDRGFATYETQYAYLRKASVGLCRR